LKVAVVGAGGWGTALAKTLFENGLDVLLWCREESVLRSMRERHENDAFLPGIRLPAGLAVTGVLPESVSGAEIVVLAVPSPFLRATLAVLKPELVGARIVVSAIKGLEEATHLRMTQVISEHYEGEVVAISGPTFAREVARGEPSALVAASSSEAAALEIQERFSTSSFRIYTNDDVIGVELSGALKNVIALAVGVITGLGLGHNPIAALITRGLAEISRLVEAMGGRRETVAGLSGMGDLVLTSTGHLSRNRRVGIELGRGRKLPDILADMQQVAEGIRTTHAAVSLAREFRVDMPIVLQMERLLRGETTPQEVQQELMTRPLKSERG
jgi:glycerol-3-phosphate dehydrogenase (NAD(P)+)